MIAVVFLSIFFGYTLTTWAGPTNDHGTPAWLRREVAKAVIERAEPLSASADFQKGWKDALLFQQGTSTSSETRQGEASLALGVKITCLDCYAKGGVTVTLSSDGEFDIEQAINNVKDTMGDIVKNITTAVVDKIEDVGKNLSRNIVGDGAGDEIDNLFRGEGGDDESGTGNISLRALELDVESIPFPTIEFDFNTSGNITGIPEVSLEIQFNHLELYAELEAALTAGATYTINLYTTNTPIGIKLRNGLLFGVALSFDLIFDVEAEIDMSSGFHLEVDDGFSVKLGLFQQEFADMVFPGGKFEFLPMEVRTPGGTLKAILRIGVHAGVSISTPSGLVPASIGIESGIFANVAEFVTNISVSDADNHSEDCAVKTFALGAAAGATVGIGGHIWGPHPETTTPIFYTTLNEACAKTRKPPTTSAEAVPRNRVLQQRQDLEAITLTTTVKLVGQTCKSSGLVNCPASLQGTTTEETVLTLVTEVPDGEEPTFPATTFDSVTSTVAFGNSAHKIIAASGSPTSFVPEATAADSSGKGSDALSGETRGVSNKVIIGVSVGIGIPVLIAIGVGLWYIWKRGTCSRRRMGSPQIGGFTPPSEGDKPGATVSVSHVHGA